MKSKIIILFILPLVVEGCATYKPLPLENKVTLVNSVSHLEADPRVMSYPMLPAHRFDPSDGLDMTEVAMLAVSNNPLLKLARDDAKIANAQAFAAGLLPDPQFGHSRDFPGRNTPATVSAFNSSLGYELSSLVSHAAYTSASGFENRKTNLDLLWQEWQVIAQARLLFSRLISQQKLLKWATQNRALLQSRYANARLALAQGNFTSDALNAALVAWQDSSKQANDLARQELQTRNDLNALLGLAPNVRLVLVQDENLRLPDAAGIKKILQSLPSRRPDLLALKSGYEAQDQRYRQAILAQFPALNLALTAASDTMGLYTHGFALSMSLPLFNGNRGNVAIQEATRQRLHDEYQTRLNSAYAEVQRLLADSELISAQLHSAELGMRVMDRAANNAGNALAEGLIDSNGNALFQSSRISKHVEVANLKQSLLENRIALLTLLGGDIDEWEIPQERAR